MSVGSRQVHLSMEVEVMLVGLVGPPWRQRLALRTHAVVSPSPKGTVVETSLLLQVEVGWPCVAVEVERKGKERRTEWGPSLAARWEKAQVVAVVVFVALVDVIRMHRKQHFDSYPRQPWPLRTVGVLPFLLLHSGKSV